MRLISHRGNLWGPDPDWENMPNRVTTARKDGFDVEVDVWSIDGKLFLGHDKPTYPIDEDFLDNDWGDFGTVVWCHAKNLSALDQLMRMGDSPHRQVFWHQNDDFTLTSGNKIWTFPGRALVENSVAVVQGYPDIGSLAHCYGICTDYAGVYRSKADLRDPAGVAVLTAYLMKKRLEGPEQVSTGEQKA